LRPSGRENALYLNSIYMTNGLNSFQVLRPSVQRPRAPPKRANPPVMDVSGTDTDRPLGAVRAGSEASENRVREGAPAAATRCIGPVSLPTASEAEAAREAMSAKLVRPARLFTWGALSTISAQRAASSPPADHRHLEVAADQPLRQLGVAAGRPALVQPVGRSAGDQQGVSSLEAERPTHLAADQPGDVGRRGGARAGGRVRPDAGVLQLFRLPLKGMHAVAVGIAVGQGAALGHARPGRRVRTQAWK
jgi:hypothetical protein